MVVSDNVLDIYLQTTAEVIRVGAGGGGGNAQDVTALTLPATVERFMHDSVALAGIAR